MSGPIVKSEISELDDDYSNSSESSGPVDLSEGTLRVFTELEQPRRDPVKPSSNQVIEVLVDGKIQIFEIQPVDVAAVVDDGIINYGEEGMTPYTTEPEFINLDTSTGNTGMPWQTNTNLDPCSLDQTYYAHPEQRYTGPIEISYPSNVLYPPPPPEANHDNHNILIQRAPTRGGRKEGKTGANRWVYRGLTSSMRPPRYLCLLYAENWCFCLKKSDPSTIVHKILSSPNLDP